MKSQIIGVIGGDVPTDDAHSIVTTTILQALQEGNRLFLLGWGKVSLLALDTAANNGFIHQVQLLLPAPLKACLKHEFGEDLEDPRVAPITGLVGRMPPHVVWKATDAAQVFEAGWNDCVDRMLTHCQHLNIFGNEGDNRLQVGGTVKGRMPVTFYPFLQATRAAA